MTLYRFGCTDYECTDLNSQHTLYRYSQLPVSPYSLIYTHFGTQPSLAGADYLDSPGVVSIINTQSGPMQGERLHRGQGSRINDALAEIEQFEINSAIWMRKLIIERG